MIKPTEGVTTSGCFCNVLLTMFDLFSVVSMFWLVTAHGDSRFLADCCLTSP